MVSPATFRHPSQLAKVVTTVDHISGGRVEVGLGAGWHEREHRAYGFEFPDLATRLERFAEQLEIVAGLLSGEELDFAGKHYRLERVRALPAPVQRPRPTLIVGGRARRGTADPAARFADEYNTLMVPPEECARARKRLDEACERAGRDPATLTMSLMTGVVVGSDRSDLLARARRTMEVRGQDGDPEAFLREHGDGMIAGTVEEARERLAEYEAAGVQRVFCQHLPHRDLDGVALIGSL
jgi:alkanesulfonate monooxygenase SsuD/methylene tetrahydromethanopterin reductase-like flavin-dependent oxidoreductase (luciferase family)